MKKNIRAFPLYYKGDPSLINTGMTLRDYFAAKALQGLCAGRTEYEQPGADAEFAYRLADEMMKQREK